MEHRRALRLPRPAAIEHTDDKKAALRETLRLIAAPTGSPNPAPVVFGDVGSVAGFWGKSNISRRKFDSGLVGAYNCLHGSWI